MTAKPLIANHGTNQVEELGSGVSLYGGTPIGGIVIWSGAVASPPEGFILCDGTAISRTDFATLFTIIGTTFGSGNGSSTFNIPNLRDRFIVGAGSAYNLNATGGSSSVTLSESQLPSHNHSISVSGTTSNPSPALTGDVRRISEGFRASGTASGVFTKVNDPNNPITGAASNSPVAGFTFDGTHTHTFSASGTSGDKGSGSSIENRPPYIALAYIIRTI